MQQLIAWMMKPAYVDRPHSVADIRCFLEGKPTDDETMVGEKPEPLSERTKTISSPKQKAQQQPIPSKANSQSSAKPKSVYSPKTLDEPSSGRNKLFWGVGIGCAVIAMIVVSVLLLKSPSMVNAVTDTIEQNAARQVTNMIYTSQVKDGMGTYQYTGYVDDNGCPDGTGKAVFSNGDHYEGPFVKGVMKGEGARYTFSTGDCFRGEMRNDQFFEGTYTVADGSYFFGTFYKGQPEHGTWYDSNGKKLKTL